MHAGRFLVAVAAVLAVAGCDGGGGSGDSSSQYDFGTTDAIGDAAGDLPVEIIEEDTGLPPGASEYPSSELLIRITEPSGSGHATTAGSVVSLSGVVFGKFTSLTWTAGTASGSLAISEGSPFWQSDSITLAPGDNLVKVAATGEEGTVTDSVVVTSNPGFMLPNALQMRPPAMFVGQSQKVLATLALGPFGSVSSGKVVLRQVDAEGALVKDQGTMLDDGITLTSGDEIPTDGVYTIRVQIACDQAGPMYFRGAVSVTDANGQAYFALSAPARFDCVPRLTTQACAAHQKTLIDAREAYFATLATTGLRSKSRQAAVAVLQADAAVAQVSDPADALGVWVRFGDGVLGAVNTGRDGLRGGSGDGAGGDPALGSVSSAATVSVPVRSKDTLLLSPFSDEFGADDETLDVANTIALLSCPAFRAAPYNGKAANLQRFREFSNFGIVALATHAEIYFHGLDADIKKAMGWHHPGGQEVLWTGETVTCGNLLDASGAYDTADDCPSGMEWIVTVPKDGDTPAQGTCYDATQVDVMTGRAVLGDRTWGVTPAFLDFHVAGQPFPDSLVYLGACRTLYNGTLAATLFAAGAKAIAGFSGVVSSSFAARQARGFFDGMMKQGMTAGRAYGVGAEDPAHPGTYFRMFGAKGLSVSDSGILNDGFETGDITAWTRSGDGRVVPQLGVTKPVEGKFMGIVSTGLGYTDKVGSLEQKFCVFPGTTRLTFWWKFYSEEFREFCGTAFQDSFQASLTNQALVSYPVISLAVDDLCIQDDCDKQCLDPEGNWKQVCDKDDVCTPCVASDCGAKEVGLVKADVKFDQNLDPNVQTGVWVTGTTDLDVAKGDPKTQKGDWQKATYDVSAMVGDSPVPVTLKFYATDRGDSIYDTAVLIDGIQFH